MRRLYAVDLWEISIVTFPLLAGARVRAVKAMRDAACHNSADERLLRKFPRVSFSRKRAESEWRGVTAMRCGL